MPQPRRPKDKFGKLVDILAGMGAFTTVELPTTMQELLTVLVGNVLLDEDDKVKVEQCTSDNNNPDAQLSMLVDVFIKDGILESSYRRDIGLE